MRGSGRDRGEIRESELERKDVSVQVVETVRVVILDDGKDDFLEAKEETRITKDHFAVQKGHLQWWTSKGSTTPRPEHHRIVTILEGNQENRSDFVLKKSLYISGKSRKFITIFDVFGSCDFEGVGDGISEFEVPEAEGHFFDERLCGCSTSEERQFERFFKSL